MSRRWTDHTNLRHPAMLVFDLLFAFALIYLLRPVVGAQFEQPPLQYLNVPFPTESPVHAGDPIPLTVERCNNSSEPLYLESARTLRNVDTGRAYSLDSGAGVVDPGCSTAYVASSTVPLQAVPGRYVLSAVVRMRGTWKSFDVNYRSAEFEVVTP